MNIANGNLRSNLSFDAVGIEVKQRTSMRTSIELINASKSYGLQNGVPMRGLEPVSLTILAGEYVIVLGKSGSGKSTLLNLVAGLDRATSGIVHVAGQNLGDSSENTMALWRGRNIGVVFQFFQLLPTLTIVENVMLAMELVGVVAQRDRRSRAQALVALVGIADHAHKLPSELSGGQQQRAAIARAMANDPPIILADEPTGNLDNETATAICDVFALLAQQGKTLLVVTHDAKLAQSAHRVIRIQDGSIVDDMQLPELKNAVQQ